MGKKVNLHELQKIMISPTLRNRTVDYLRATASGTIFHSTVILGRRDRWLLYSWFHCTEVPVRSTNRYHGNWGSVETEFSFKISWCLSRKLTVPYFLFNGSCGSKWHRTPAGATQSEQVWSDVPDKDRYPGPPGWVLDVRFTPWLRCNWTILKFRQKYLKAGWIKKKNSVDLVRERTIPTERPPPVGEVSANFCG